MSGFVDTLADFLVIAKSCRFPSSRSISSQSYDETSEPHRKVLTSVQINYRMRITLNDGRQMTGQMLAFDKVRLQNRIKSFHC